MSSDATWSNATLADDVQLPDDQNISLITINRIAKRILGHLNATDYKILKKQRVHI